MLRYILLLLFVLESLEKSDVYFTKEISSEKIVEMFKKLNVELKGKVGLKVHTGEENGPYFLRPSLLKDIYEHTNGTFIECNTAYLSGKRHLTDLHRQILKSNGWSDYRTVIMDENNDTDFSLNVTNSHNISENYVGQHLTDFDSCLVLAHFKGHPMGGFGGAMKQLSIGFASRAGKAYIHSGGITQDFVECWNKTAPQLDFTAAMADAASSVVDYFKSKGGIVYINVLANISTVCDCGGTRAPKPKIRDIGILASLDPIAIDKACYDLINEEDNTGSHEWIDQSKRLEGLNTLIVGEKKGMGSQDYNLINIDNDLWYVWYIILPVIGLIIIGVVIGLVFYFKKKGKDKNDKLVDDDENEDKRLGPAVVSTVET